MSGFVSLVGAGPGDPGLLTVRAAQRLAEADVVYYDALIAKAVLVHCRQECRLISVGKRRGATTLPQRRIESALIREAEAGRRVVRLKGGDPFVFGRGGEEALALAARRIPFEVVPGVSSGIGAPGAAGIPLTHRGLAGSVAFITAHDLSGGIQTDAIRGRLSHLARGADTLVVFMAGSEMAQVREVLLAAGLPGSLPVARIESGTMPGEKIVTGTLADRTWLDAPRESGPVLLVAGKTVTLSERLRPASAEASRGSARTESFPWDRTDRPGPDERRIG